MDIKNISNKKNTSKASQAISCEKTDGNREAIAGAKLCKHCGEYKEINEFGYDSSKSDDRATICKKCKRDMERESKRRRRSKLMESELCQQLANLGMDLSSAATRSKVNVRKLEDLAKGRNTMEDDEWARLKGIMSLEMGRRGVRWDADEGVLK